jgi:hypothetical protein
MRREENIATKRVMNMDVQGRLERKGSTLKRRIDCVRQDMREMDVSDEMTGKRMEGEDMLRRPQVSRERKNRKFNFQLKIFISSPIKQYFCMNAMIF